MSLHVSVVVVALVVVSLCLVNVSALSKFTKAQVMKQFNDGNALKVITGLRNFNYENIKNVVTAAVQGGASLVDIACDAEIIKLAKKTCNGQIPVCVSSITPLDFVMAVQSGADMIEIGNYDGFYPDGRVFTADDVIKMTKETRALLPTIPLSVTIPHTLSIEEQVTLAKALQVLGVDVLQTEGKMGVSTTNKGVKELIDIAAPTIASAYALSRAVSIPVMCASGLTDVTAPLALAAGARGVGVGSMVNKLSTSQQMYLAVTVLANSISRSVHTENTYSVSVGEVSKTIVGVKHNV